jgi:hypothetical protein
MGSTLAAHATLLKADHAGTSVGTHAARPAAGTVAAGTLYWETDTTALFESDGATTWTNTASAVAELGYFSSASAVASLASTTFAAVTGYTKTVTVPAGGRPVYVEIDAGTLILNAAGNATLDILEDGVSTTGAAGQSKTVAANAFFGLSMRVRRTPSAGSHTYLVSYKVSAGSLSISPFAEPYDMAITLR